MRLVLDREKVRDIISRDIQRLRINIEQKENWFELYRVESSYFLKVTNIQEVFWVKIPKEVAEILMKLNEHDYYSEADNWKHLIESEIQKEAWRRF